MVCHPLTHTHTHTLVCASIVDPVGQRRAAIDRRVTCACVCVCVAVHARAHTHYDTYCVHHMPMVALKLAHPTRTA